MMNWDQYIENMTKIEEILGNMGMSQDERNAWYLTLNLVFGQKMPIDLMCNGDVEKVMSHLIALTQGNIGG